MDQPNFRIGRIGSLSDELPKYGNYNTAIKNALSVARNNGLFGARIFACDDLTENWPTKVIKALRDFPKNTNIYITGAWYHQNSSGGCVNTVYDQLKAAGFKNLEICDSAVVYDEDED